jgi:hypothetical protein
MRITNRATSRTGQAGRSALGIALAGGTAFFVLAGGGIAMASPLPGHTAAHAIGAQPGWNRVSNTPGTTGAGVGRGGRPPVSALAPVQGQPGWNRVSNIPGATGAGGKGGLFPGAAPAPGQGAGGQGGLFPGSTSAPGTGAGGQGGQGGLLPGSASTPSAGTGGAGGVG